MLNTKKLLYFIVSIFLTVIVTAQEARIPLKNVRQPSKDLVLDGKELTSEEAWQLQNDPTSPIDLSLLNPKQSSVYQPEEYIVEDKVEIDLEIEHKFSGVISSNSGLFRFNILNEKNDNQIVTVVLEKTLHTYLLRRNLLRKLGYIVPVMKWVPSIKVSFDSKEQRDHFLKRMIPEATFGASSRWTGKKDDEYNDDELSVELSDVVLMIPSEKDHYNVAMGVPPRQLVTRTLRSLIVPYALLDLNESVNKFSWNVGRIDNDSLVLPHFTLANMDASMDDVKWMARKLLSLERSDFETIVKDASFPEPVKKIVIEKIISRRNSLLKTILGDVTKDIEVNEKVSHGEKLEKGKLTTDEWEGYASRFAHGIPDSPFKDFQYFIFSKLQASTIDSLVSKVNEYLSVFDPNEVRTDFHKEQFTEGLNHFVETGELKDFGVKTWISPTLDGNLIASRDIVVGNYLGTDNMVQLADTFGYSLSLGAHIGIENIEQWPTAFIKAGVSFVKTYTHLKPVKTLKASFKEPYKNMVVPLMKLKLKKKFDELSQIEFSDDEEANKKKEELVKEIVTIINENLGVGESLIITDRLMPNVVLQGNFNVFDARVSAGVGTDYVMAKRLHFYRKNSEVLQIYDDRGKSVSLSFNMGLDYKLPIIRANFTNVKGSIKLKAYSANLNTKVDENPDFFRYAKALYNIFESSDFELLETIKKPVIIKNSFHDKASRMSFLVWRSQYLKGNAQFEVEDSEGLSGRYISLTNESQSGINYESFARDIINFYLGKYLTDWKVQISTERWKNPSHTYKGIAQTYSSRFEAQLDEDDNTSKSFIGLTWRQEGWSASAKRIKKVFDNINEKFATKIFDENSLKDADRLNLYDIAVNINIYRKGIDALKQIDSKKLEDLQRKYLNERSFRSDCRSSRGTRIRTARTLIACGNLSTLVTLNNRCKKETTDIESSECYLKLSQEFYEHLEFNDFKNLIGQDNMFVYGTVNGFRKNSEILNDPVKSNTIGKVKGKYWNGPIDVVRELIDVQNGEFFGYWMRESL